MPYAPYFDGGFSQAELKDRNREPFDTANPSKVLCTCGYWRRPPDLFAHTNECPANTETKP